MASNDDFDAGRRDLIKLGAAATVAVSLGVARAEPLAGQAPAAAAAAPSTAAPAFFTPQEFAMVDELSELIIPSDGHSPGARAARVAAYIDSRLAEAWGEQDRIDWRAGLARIDELAKEAGASFMQSSPPQRLALLTRIAQREQDPQLPEERFFAALKARVINAYYTSEIGIKQELEYKGNSYLAEFAGTDVS